MQIILILLFSTFILWVFYRLYRKPDLHFEQLAPTLMATGGILGTFIGIVLGLWNFDAADIFAIERSIPELLGGLKTAFFTSILGIAAAAGAKFLVWRRHKRGSGNRPVMPEDIYAVLKDQRDALNKLTEEFPRFADRVSDASSQQLVAALNQVVRNFNDNLSEQFGENFTRFNDAVGQLLAWQQEHKKELNALRRHLKQTTTGLSASKEALAEIAQHTKTIPEQLKMLDGIVGHLDEQQSALEARLEAFPSIQERVVEAMGRIEQKISGTATRICCSIESSSSRYQQLAQQTIDLVEIFDNALHEAGKKLENVAESAFKQQSSRMKELFDGLEKETKESWDKHHRSLSSKSNKFDRLMHEEIERAMQEMASRLAAITGRFVTDYSELTERMKSVVMCHEQPEKATEPADEEFA